MWQRTQALEDGDCDAADADRGEDAEEHLDDPTIPLPHPSMPSSPASSTPGGYALRFNRDRGIHPRLHATEGPAHQAPAPHRGPGARDLQNVDDHRYCIDILQQISAVKAAIDKVALGVLEDHVLHCMIAGAGDEQRREERTAELHRRRLATRPQLTSTQLPEAADVMSAKETPGRVDSSFGAPDAVRTLLPDSMTLRL